MIRITEKEEIVIVKKRVTLENSDGSLINSEEEFVKEVVNFFKKLYTTNNCCFCDFEGASWSPISNMVVEWLERPFQVEEFKKAILIVMEIKHLVLMGSK